MGEWSEYFEDFPEENPANWVNGRFDPAAAARLREIEKKRQLQRNLEHFKRRCSKWQTKPSKKQCSVRSRIILKKVMTQVSDLRST